MGRGLTATDLGDRGAGGLGLLLAQQLIAAGEHVVEVPPKLVRVQRIWSRLAPNATA